MRSFETMAGGAMGVPFAADRMSFDRVCMLALTPAVGLALVCFLELKENHGVWPMVTPGCALIVVGETWEVGVPAICSDLSKESLNPEDTTSDDWAISLTSAGLSCACVLSSELLILLWVASVELRAYVQLPGSGLAPAVISSFVELCLWAMPGV